MSDGKKGISGIDPRAMLGEFQTPLWFPRYSEGTWGPWSLQVIPMILSRGYWGRNYHFNGSVILTGSFGQDEVAWMSIVPMEVESQEIGIAAAHGHTVVLGLGMGWCAANVALNPAIDRVTVVERDADIIRMSDSLGLFDQLPEAARAKIEVVHDDALTWRPDSRVDSLQADIWAKFIEPQKWDDIRRMQDNIAAGSIYFWGQETELWRLACRARGAVPDWLEEGELAALIEQTGLPLITDPGAEYAQRIADAARWWTPKQERWWEFR